MSRQVNRSGIVVLMVCAAIALGACARPTEEAPVVPPGAEAPAVEPAAQDAPQPAEPRDKVFAFEPVPEGGRTTLIIGQRQQPDSLYIYGGTSLAGAHVLHAIYDGPIESLGYEYQAVILERLPVLGAEDADAALELVTVEAGRPVVDAASHRVVTATETLADLPQLTVRFRIRDAITWQDGTPVTAADSVFSRELACDPDTPTLKDLCLRTEHYIALDDKTVEWRGIPGYTDQTYYTNFYTPLARHQPGTDGRRMDEMTALEVAGDESFTRRPYAYGPFRVTEWVAGDRIVLARNEHYWRAEEGLPFLREVIHRFMDDGDTLLQALADSDVDVATQDGLDITQFDALEEARVAGQITPHYVPGTVWEHIDFSLQPADGRVAPGACKAVRKAVALATNRQAMVDDVQRGRTQVQDGLVPAGHWAHAAGELTTYAYDPQAARQLLDEVGFTDADGDGVREAQREIRCPVTLADGSTRDAVIPAGTPLSLELSTTAGSEMRRRTAEAFSDDMARMGVEVTIEYLAPEAFFEKSENAPLSGRRYDLAQFAWITGVQPPVALYFCDNIPGAANAWAGQNNTGWCQPEFDRLARQAEATLDRDEARALYARALAVFADEVPVLPLARVKVMATRPDLMNFAPDASVYSETWNIETWGFRSPD